MQNCFSLGEGPNITWVFFPTFCPTRAYPRTDSITGSKLHLSEVRGFNHSAMYLTLLWYPIVLQRVQCSHISCHEDHRRHFMGLPGIRVPPLFEVLGTVPPLFTSCHSCGTTRRLRRSPDSLARFVEKSARGKGRKMEKTGKGRQIWYPTFCSKWRQWWKPFHVVLCK